MDVINKYQNKRMKVISGFFLLGLVLLVTGVSYAFFAYGKTGLYTHTINGGKMNIIYDETTGNNITIDNAYPLTDEEALNEAIEFDFTVTGYNESEKNVYYAIEMDYGNEVDGKTRFKDTDMKLSLSENDTLVIENEIYQNLKEQGIYYGYIKSGTSEANPVINNYKLRIWINDNVYVSNTIEDNTTLWDDDDWNWAYNNLDENLIYQIEDGSVTKLSEVGFSVYQTSVFGNLYGSFKVNVMANLSGNDVGMLFYDANGGEFTPQNTSLTTNMVTMQRPVLENKSFLGWSSQKNATEVEYYPGDYYSGSGKTLYAIYGDTRNVMVPEWPTEVLDFAYGITDIIFIRETNEKIEERCASSELGSGIDLTYNNQGKVTGWVELDGDERAIFYIASDSTTYLLDCANLFSPFVNYLYIDMGNVDTSMVTDMKNMFTVAEVSETSETSNCFSNAKVETLEKNNSNYNINNILMICEPTTIMIKAQYLNTSNVTNMNSMFHSGRDTCQFITAISSVEYYDTSNVMDMSYMFANVKYENVLDLSNFDTSKVTDMSYMFYDCREITEIKVESFNTSKVTDMSYMFYGCWLSNLDLSNFDTSQVTDMSHMFYGNNIKELAVETFDTSAVTDMSGMFNGCQKLVDLDLSNFNTNKVTNMSSMFFDCRSLIALDLKKFDTTQVTDMSYMYSFCQKIQYINLSSFITDNVTNMSQMFSECVNLGSLDLSNFDFSNVTSYESIFYRTGNSLSNGVYTTIYVKDETAQNWILNLSSTGTYYTRPSTWSTSNITIKNT